MKLKFVSSRDEHFVHVPGCEMDLFGLSHVFESDGLALKLVTSEVGVFDIDGSEVRVLRNGSVVVKDSDKERARRKTMRIISLMSQSLGKDLILEG